MNTPDTTDRVELCHRLAKAILLTSRSPRLFERDTPLVDYETCLIEAEELIARLDRFGLRIDFIDAHVRSMT